MRFLRRLGQRYPIFSTLGSALMGAAIGAVGGVVLPGIGLFGGAALGAIAGGLIAHIRRGSSRHRRYAAHRPIHVHHHPMPMGNPMWGPLGWGGHRGYGAPWGW